MTLMLLQKLRAQSLRSCMAYPNSIRKGQRVL